MRRILTDENFQTEVLDNAGPVVVEVGADWCGTCHIMDPVLEKVAIRYRGRLKVGKLDLEENWDVTARYGVREIPTFLFFRRGELVGRIVGAVSRQELEAQLVAKLLDGY
ncbi:MAG: thioredoxin family protein [Rhodothermales bacterium]